MSDLSELRRDLGRLLEDSDPLQHAIGQFGKQTAIDAVQGKLGSDQAFSGLRRKVRLTAGYDTGEPVVLNLRPAGLWFLAEDGRKRSKRVYPRRRGGKKALVTPHGPRASFKSGRSRGLKVLSTTTDDIESGVVKAAEEGLNDMAKKVFG